MERKHITWPLCLLFSVVHALAVAGGLGLVYLLAREFSEGLGGLVFLLGRLPVALTPFFGVYWCYLYVSRYNLYIPYYYCTRCGYNLTGNVSGVCPECGGEFEHR